MDGGFWAGILLYAIMLGLTMLFSERSYRNQQARSHRREEKRTRQQYRIAAAFTENWLSIERPRHQSKKTGDGRLMQSFGSFDLPSVVTGGLLLYETAESQAVVYTPGLDLTGFTYLRPFAIFTIVGVKNAHTMEHIRFDLLTDEEKPPVLSCTALCRLLPGDTFIPAKHWLPIPAGTRTIEDWTLCLYTGDVLLYRGDFRVDVGGGDFRQYLDGDGELSDQLLALLDEPSPKEKRSLDDLLQ